MKIILAGLSFLLLCGRTYAVNSDDLLHPVAHAAGSYAVTHITEVVCKKVSTKSKLTCSLIGVGVAIAVGAAVEVTQKGEDARGHARGILQDLGGAGLAFGIINLDF